MIWLCNMAYPTEDNINFKTNDKRTKYQQLVFEMRDRRIGYLENVFRGRIEYELIYSSHLVDYSVLIRWER